MIEYRDGDIFAQPDITHICHQLNCQCVARSGIAGTIRTLYPEALVKDDNSVKGDRKKLGTYYAVKCHDGKTIINIYGQYRFGGTECQTDYYALKKAFWDIEDELYRKSKNKNLVLGIPWGIGCGLANGNWEEVEAIIKYVFATSTTKVVICKI